MNEMAEPLYRSAPGNEIVEKDDHGDHKENMDQTAGDVHHKSNEPQYEQNADDRV
jgi:hypothetical protein